MIKDTQMGMTWFVQLGERTHVCTLTGLWGCILGVKLISVGAQRQVEGVREGSGSERQEDISSWGRKSF